MYGLLSQIAQIVRPWSKIFTGTYTIPTVSRGLLRITGNLELPKYQACVQVLYMSVIQTNAICDTTVLCSI